MSAYDHAAVTRAERRRGAGPCDAERAYWPKYTLGEVAKHVSLKDGWIVIYERVAKFETGARRITASDGLVIYGRTTGERLLVHALTVRGGQPDDGGRWVIKEREKQQQAQRDRTTRIDKP